MRTVTDTPNTIAGLLRIAAELLCERSDSPRLDAEVILGNLLGATRSALTVRRDDAIDADTERAYRELIVRRAGGNTSLQATSRLNKVPSSAS